MRRVIVNSTPLISLSIINKLELLKSLYEKIYIPHGVYEEVCLDVKGRIGNDILSNNDYFIVKKIKNLYNKILELTKE